ncbi:MAG TPA: kelch repeat-containing protein, partial [Vicinamibacterales bacterium]
MRLWRILIAAASMWALCASAHAATLSITNTGTDTGGVGVRFGTGGVVCNPPGGGTCAFTIPNGSTVTLQADSPATPGVFSSGTGDATACGTSICTFVINQDSSVVATFAHGGPSVALHIALAGDGTGNVGADNDQCQNFELGFSGCTLNYYPGSVATLQGRSMPGNIFTNFSGGTGDASLCASTSPCVFTLNTDSSVTANFSKLTTVSVLPSSATVNVGQQQSFSATGGFTSGQTRNLQGGPGNWQPKRPLLASRFDFGLAAIGRNLYAVGGGVGGSPSALVDQYDPGVGALQLTDAWTAVASLHTPRMGHGVAVVGGKIYAIGGATTDNVEIASVEIYDPATNTWDDATADPLPSARSQFATVVVGSVVYVLGGGNSGNPPLQTVDAYDTVSNTWSSKAVMPTARSFFAAAAVGGKIYAFGDPSGAVDAYDIAANTWSSRAPMPHPRSALAAVAIDGLIYAVGGQNPTMTGIVDVYNPALDAWTTAGSMPTARGEVGAAALDGRLWVAGGITTTDASSATAAFEAFRPAETSWWSSNPSVATVTQNGSANALGAGTATIDARAGAIDCATGNCATLTVTDNNNGGGGGDGGGDNECAHITFDLATGSSAFSSVHIVLVDPSTGQAFDSFDAPIGEALGAPEVTIRLVFAAPDGFTVSPSYVDLTIHCGDDLHVALLFAPIDTTPPVLTLPGNITVDATSPAGAVVTYSASATDAVSGTVAVSCSPAS